MSLNILTADGLKRIDSITKEGVVTALGYTPANSNVETTVTGHIDNDSAHVTDDDRAYWDAKSEFSGDYYDLNNAPSISEDNTGMLHITDEEGNIVVRIDSDGVHTTEVEIGSVLIGSAISSHTGNKDIHITDEERFKWNNINEFSGDYNDLKNAPDIVEDGSGMLHITDEEGNVAVRIDSDGIHAAEIEVAGVFLGSTVRDHIDDTEVHITAEERFAWNNRKEFSGDYNDLVNAPDIVEDGSGNMIFSDESGYIIAQIDQEGFRTTTVTAEDIIVNGSSFVHETHEHISDKDIHITAQERIDWNSKSDFSGSYSDLINAPNISEDNSNNLVFSDPNGYVIFQADASGIKTTAISTDEIIVSNTNLGERVESFGVSIDKHTLEIKDIYDKIDDLNEDVDNFNGGVVDYNKINNAPSIINDYDSELSVVDPDENVIFKVNADGTHTTALTIGGEDVSSLLNQKVDKEEGKSLSSNDFTNEAVDVLSAILEYEPYDNIRTQSITHFKKILFEKHKPVYESVVTEPTCSKRGYTTHTCYCGCSHIDSYVDTTEHNWGPYSKYGSGRVHECITCGEKEYDGNIRLLLNYEFVPSTPDTFDEYKTITLVVEPPDGYTQNVRLTGRYPETSLIDVPAGKYYIDTNLDALQQFDDYTLETKWTVKYFGDEDPIESSTFYVNENDLYPDVTLTARYVIVHDHDYRGVVTAPTCTEQGYTTKTCKICGESYKTDYVDALGHDWGEYVDMGDYYVRECARCGEQETSADITVCVEFEDNVVPDEVSVFNVVVMPPDGYKQILRMTTRYPEVTLTNMPTGEYSFVAQTENIQPEGCALTVKHLVQYDDEEPFESNTFTLSKEAKKLSIKVIYKYHIHEYTSVVTPPTSTSEGYTTYICDCGDSYIDNYIKIYSIGDTVYGPDDIEVIRLLYPAPHNGDWEKVLDENGNPTTNASGDFLWMVKELRNGTVTIYVEFEDEVIPDALDMIPLITTSPDGEPETSKLNKYTPRFRLRNVPLGTFSVQEVISEMQIDGYDLTVTYMAHLEGEDPVVGNTVTLTKENPNGYITITNRYIKIHSIGDTVYGPDDVDVIRSLYLAPNNGDWVKVLDENGQPQTNEDGDFLWIIEELRNGIVNIYIKFEDEVIPDALEAIPLIITRPNGKSHTSKLNKHTPRLGLVELPLGTYSVQEVISEMQVSGYNLTVTHMAHLEGEDPVVGNTVTLTKENPNGYITITNRYSTGHTHEYTSVVTDPTCTSEGYTTHTCACGDKYTNNYISDLGHDWGEEPSDGSPRICKRCGVKDAKCKLEIKLEFENDVIPDGADGSNVTITTPGGWRQGQLLSIYDSLKFKDIPLGTYTVEEDEEDMRVDGYPLYVKYMVKFKDEEPFEGQTFTFTEERTDVTVTIIHSYTTEIHDHEYRSVITEPTCTERGYTTKTCTICGESYKTDYVDALGHDWEYDNDRSSRVCTRCGKPEMLGKITMMMKFEDDFVPTLDSELVYFMPTGSEEDKYREHMASKISYTVPLGTYTPDIDTSRIQADGYDLIVVSRQVKYAIGDPIESNSVTITDSMLFADYTIVYRYVPIQDHEYTSIVTPPTCSTPGYTTHTCSVCGISYIDSYTKEIRHDYDNNVCSSCGNKKSYLTVRMEFDGDLNPAGVDGFNVKITPPTGNSVIFDADIDDPEIRFGDPELGSYTIEEQTDKMQAEGYTLITKYMVQYGDGEPFESQHLILTNENIDITVTITNKYVQNHSHEYTSIVKDPTCTENGCTIHTCSICGYSYATDYTAMLNHDWVVSSDKSSRTCTRCGESELLGEIATTIEYEDGFVPSEAGGLVKFTILHPNGEDETVRTGVQSPLVRHTELPLGTYRFELDTSGMQAEGYEVMVSSYIVEYEGNDPIESQEAALTEDMLYAMVTAVVRYVEISAE